MRTRAILAPIGFLGCPRCGEVKPTGEFYRHSRKSGRPQSYCKDCRRAQRKEGEGRTDPTAKARFWAKVEKTDDCWNWIGGKDDRGYGFFYFRGRNTRAHRISLLFAGVVVPDYKAQAGTRIVVDHICKNLGCVRPDHLRLVTQAENCGPLAKPTPHWINATKDKCRKGHPLSGANLAIYRARPAHKKSYLTRICLTCYPRNWMYAVIERKPPPGAKMKWRGPATGNSPFRD